MPTSNTSLHRTPRRLRSGLRPPTGLWPRCAEVLDRTEAQTLSTVPSPLLRSLLPLIPVKGSLDSLGGRQGWPTFNVLNVVPAPFFLKIAEPILLRADEVIR